jgi:RHS repeat-associated protein
LLATTKTGTVGEYEYATADHLGSPRAWTSGENGNLTSLKRQDFTPFGIQLVAGVGIRNTSNGYGAETPRLKFTGKEREAATNLDNFIARSYSSEQGRFISPDPFNPLISGDKEAIALYANDPQNWNKYSYALNQPLRYIDPDGKVPLFVVGAVVGAVTGTALKTIELAIKGEDITSRESLKQIGAAALGGAVEGALAGLTGGWSLAGKAFTGAGSKWIAGVAGNMIAGGAERAVNGEAIFDPEGMMLDGIFGIMSGSAEIMAGVGDGAARAIQRNVMSIDSLNRGFVQAYNEMADSVGSGFRYAIEASTSRFNSWMNFRKGLHVGSEYAVGETIEFGLKGTYVFTAARQAHHQTNQFRALDIMHGRCPPEKSPCLKDDQGNLLPDR